MSAITPVYGWPFQQLPDPPDGASLGEDLALAIEATVASLIGTLTPRVDALEDRTYRDSILVSSSVASITFSAIPTDIGCLRILWTARDTNTGFVAEGINMRVNGDTGGNYASQYVQGSNSSASSAATSVTATSASVGLLSMADNTAGVYGTGVIEITGWDTPHASNLGFNFQSAIISPSLTTSWTNNGGGIYRGAGPYSSITLFPAAGNFASGSKFYLLGQRWP